MDFLKLQDQLQREAEEVIQDLDLDCLNAIGTPVMVGSYALGLMIQKDIDITVICTSLAELQERISALAVQFFSHPNIRVVSLRDDSGWWNSDKTNYPDGLYIMLKYRAISSGVEWNLDIWFVDEPERQPDLQHLKIIPPQLDAEKKLAILQIKYAWQDSPEYGSQVRSYDIYFAVLADGVRSPEDFIMWLDKET